MRYLPTVSRTWLSSTKDFGLSYGLDRPASATSIRTWNDDHAQFIRAGFGGFVSEGCLQETNMHGLVLCDLLETAVRPVRKAAVYKILLRESGEPFCVERVLEMLQRKRKVQDIDVWTVAVWSMAQRGAQHTINHAPLSAPSRGRGWEKATPARTVKEKMPNVGFIIVGSEREGEDGRKERNGSERRGAPSRFGVLRGKPKGREQEFDFLYAFGWNSRRNPSH